MWELREIFVQKEKTWVVKRTEMSRVVFERSLCDGFRTTKVEQIVCSAYGKKLFVGTTDGLLAAYECRQESSAIGEAITLHKLIW